MEIDPSGLLIAGILLGMGFGSVLTLGVLNAGGWL